MNNNELIRSGIKKIFVTVFTQMIILCLSIITGFVLPQKMGPNNYGYWQVYLFYLAYVNIFGLGFNDGLALFYGGYEYKNLPFEKIRSSMRFFYIYLMIVTIVGLLLTILVDDIIYQRIYQGLLLNIPVTCIQCIVLTTFLATNKTSIYNAINIILKVLSVSSYLCLLVLHVTSAVQFVYIDLLTRIIITLICMYLGREFLFGKVKTRKEGMVEFKEKSFSGFKITIAIIASMLIPVIGRTVIEANESITTYGIYSFAMSLLTIIMMFTTTIGLVIFPLLKKISEQGLSDYYSKFAFICDTLIYVALLAYIPLVLIVKNIMIEYMPSLCYLHILLVMCIPLGRMQLLITPYYKAFRMEKQFLIANLIGVVSMFVMTSVVYKIFNSIFAVALCTTLVLTAWTFITEFYISKKKEIQFGLKNIFVQVLMMVAFVIAGFFKDILCFVMIYLPSLIIYFWYYRKNINKIIILIKTKRNRESIMN